jgi:prophage regulatory protein
MASKGEFPKPIKIGLRSSAWLENEVRDWIRERILESRGIAS